MKVNNILLSIAIASLIAIIGFGGWELHKTLRPCPLITTDTIEVVDSSWHTIEDSLKLTIKNLQGKVDYWKNHRDTVVLPGDSIPVPADVDTAAILKDYFSKYSYTLKNENDTISIKDSLIITENAPVWNQFSYKFKIPFTTINNSVDNSVTYNSYLQFGLGIPVYRFNADSLGKVNIMDLRLELTYTFKKGYFGAGYQPNTNTIEARFGTTLLKFKQKK